MAGPDWMPMYNHDGGGGNVGVVTGYRNEGMEVLVLWRATRTQTNHRFGPYRDVRMVGRAEMPTVGDIVTRGA